MSTEHQRYSPDNQKSVIDTFAAARGFDVVRTYQDNGKSGLTLSKRPALQQLLADVLSGTADFKAILVLDVSRWGRFQDTDQAAHYEYICRDAGVEVHYCSEPFENDGGPLAAILKTMKRVMAAEYSRELSTRISRAQRHQAGLGFAQGGETPLGLRRQVIGEDGKRRNILQPGQSKAFRTDKIIFAPGPAREIALVRRIFELYVHEEMRLGQIEIWLNRKKYRQASGRPWTSAAVRGVLTQPLYSGRYVFGRRYNNLGRKSMLSPDRWVDAEVMEPIVPAALFEAAQARRAATMRTILSKQELLSRLAQLLEEEGHLSGPLVDRCPYLPNRMALRNNFGSVRAAFRMVGYEIPSRCAKNPDGHVYSNEDLLDELRRIHRERGYLCAHAIVTDSRTPGKSTFVRRFGSLRRAFALAGFPMTWGERQIAGLAHKAWVGGDTHAPRRPIRRNPDGSPFTDEQLIENLRTLLKSHGHLSGPIIDSEPSFPGRNFYYKRFGKLTHAYFLAGYFGTKSEISIAASARKKQTAGIS
ncbi:MAG: recombinase family protein [Sphingomonadales bacterium]|nr:recombinase family protein [Sphingomonadales bacterium]